MKRTLLVVCLLLAACTPSESAIQTAIVRTQVVAAGGQPTRVPIQEATDTAEPVATPTIRPTATRIPTRTASPSSTPEPFNIDEARAELLDSIATAVGAQPDVEEVTLVRFNNGVLEIELKTLFASQDNQADVSWNIIRGLAGVFSQYDEPFLTSLSGGEHFIIHLTTYSTGGDYRYQSDTDYATLQMLAGLSMAYEEWIVAANAGFR